MRFDFRHSSTESKKWLAERLFEALPGAISLTIIVGLILLSFFRPFFASMVVIIIGFYLLVRFIYSIFFILILRKRLSLEKATDWMDRVKGFDIPYEYWRKLDLMGAIITPKEKASLAIHQKELEILKKSKQLPSLSTNLHHLLITYLNSESYEKFEAVIKSINGGKFPSERILMLVLLDKNSSNILEDKIQEIKKRHGETFLDFFIYRFPFDSHEAANLEPLTKKIKEYFESKGIAFEDVIVSLFDSVIPLPAHYLSSLTYYYMVYPHRTQAIFKFFTIYGDDSWRRSGIARVLNLSSSFFGLTESANPLQVIPLSDFSISLKTILELECSPLDLIFDPTMIFWKAFIYFDGSYNIVPVYFTLSKDLIEGKDFRSTVDKIYHQKLKEASQIKKLPIITKAFFQARYIPWYKKVKYITRLLEYHILDVIWSPFLSAIAWLPVIFVWPQFVNMRLYYSTWRISTVIPVLIFLNIFILTIICLLFFPKRKVKYSFFQLTGYIFEWLLIPFFAIFLTAFPALINQIGLAFYKKPSQRNNSKIASKANTN
ncbi:MAG: hypothetical protein KBB01_03975 [Candidatus Omnitrophica bacterium]|jgi:hypothetical protein|nr:hypothetical protein [Candidatus Omnitrophota bacterium]